MKVLVTGGAGYIGSHVVRHLGRAGHDIVVLDNLCSGHEWAVLCGNLVIGDLAAIKDLERLFHTYNFDAVIHCAAHSNSFESLKFPYEYYMNNTVYSLRLWELCKRFRVSFIVYSSSASVYGNPAISPIEETCFPSPMTPYGASKLMTERMLEDIFCNSDTHFAILRYFNVAGAEPQARIGECHDPETHLMPRILRSAMKRQPVYIYGTDYPTDDGTCVRDYIHVEDLATAHLASLDFLRTEKTSVTLNCGYGYGYSVRQIVAGVKYVTGIDFSVEEVGRRTGDAPELVASADRILSTLDWRPKHNDLYEIIRHAWEWEKRLETRRLSDL